MERSPGLQFSLLGIPVRLELWFFIIPALALAMRANGFSPSITLHGLGGHTAWPARRARGRW